ncbi:MAG: heparinase II/III family protein [Deltaproteobacteria bacterium]|jgi:uncharacterized heparinase superfamily protein|nr:heparinase II/III family protein [Deltaproteobacteria bacterium]
MNLLHLFHAAKYLKSVQIYGRLWFKLYKPKPDMSSAPATRSIKADWVTPCKKNPSLLSTYCFQFLNQEHGLNSVKDWNNPQWEKLWLYNLHYFDDLQACDAENKKALHLDLIGKWIEENPPGMGNGWEPYPTSLRIVNWIKWALDRNGLPDDALYSMAVQTRYLFKKLEYHLLGNHLFANAKALIFAGLFFDGSEAELWLNKGLKILSKQVPEQILGDGGHFELSPMYHSVILEDILDLINIMRTYGRILPVIWLSSVEKMHFWLKVMCHPDKKTGFFNDCAFGIAPDLVDLEQYAVRLGFSNIESPREGINLLMDSGYARLQKGDAVLIADVGRIGPDYLPGHAHADTLSFEFSVRSKKETPWQRIFVNSGISCYGNSRERLMQRGTACHNTLVVDGKNSSEVWDGFRVAKRAYPLGLENEDKGKQGLWIRCGHDGYTRLKGKPVHWREWCLKDNSLEIKDQVIGDFSEAVAFYHLYPGLVVDSRNRRIFSDDISMTYETDANIIIENQHYYPEFGKAVSNECLVVKPIRDEYYIKFKWDVRCEM